MNTADKPLPEAALSMADVKVGSMRDASAVVAEEVNWTVRALEFWVIGGLHGSGKTDFLSLTAGLMAPLAGSYTLFGEPMPIFDERRLKHRLRLGFVFEDSRLLHNLTVRENVALPLRYHGNLRATDADEQLQPLLARLGLVPWLNNTPGLLNRNWQKRAALARALSLRPEVLLVDNPLAGLDFRHVRWWLDLLDDLAAGQAWADQRPMTLVVTAADLRPWRDHAGQFALLKDSRFQILGDWSAAAAASHELLRELMMAGAAGEVDRKA